MCTRFTEYGKETSAYWDTSMSDLPLSARTMSASSIGSNNGSRVVRTTSASSATSSNNSYGGEKTASEMVYALAGNVAWPHPAPSSYSFACWVMFPSFLEAETVSLLRVREGESEIV
jgi:hypothetical protein